MRRSGLAATIATGVWAGAVAAGAFTLDGRIEIGAPGGAFVKLDAGEPFAVGADTFDDFNLYAFDESQNILLDRPIAVDVGADGRTEIPAGEIVASHYVFFDPGVSSRQIGAVSFDAPILGVATSRETLAATDFLADTAVTYLNPTLRGLETWTDRVWIDPDNPYRIRVDWGAASPGDYIRVFTAASPSV